jgi:hypothetical protein
MLHYPISKYKEEMAGYNKKMPKGWLSDYISANCQDKTEEEKKQIKMDIHNVFMGNSFQKGITLNYINIIRRIYADYNGIKFEPLPDDLRIY